MSKEEYLIMRNGRSVVPIMYEFYKEEFDISKHKPFLSIAEFHEAAGKWETDISIFFPAVHSYFDNKFGVVKIMDKNGQIMKFI